MAFQKARQDPYGPCRLGYLSQGVARLLLPGGVLSEEGRVGLFEHAVGRGQRPTKVLKRGVQLVLEHAVGGGEHLARIDEGAVHPLV